MRDVAKSFAVECLQCLASTKTSVESFTLDEDTVGINKVAALNLAAAAMARAKTASDHCALVKMDAIARFEGMRDAAAGGAGPSAKDVSRAEATAGVGRDRVRRHFNMCRV